MHIQTASTKLKRDPGTIPFSDFATDVGYQRFDVREYDPARRWPVKNCIKGLSVLGFHRFL
ncbi:hypothetical protein PTE30175_00146 [Pandoraea terrae]|uniref:Uncharacterized protein n=1 Tax=Pandoraea terrae TaxID=1537710 RepID=A0A5E4RJ66_9BURK|nr:hypothetical protein PTE30175_00146 [Pandoraea terrae]